MVNASPLSIRRLAGGEASYHSLTAPLTTVGLDKPECLISKTGLFGFYYFEHGLLAPV
jgi:hypothetical protein